MAKAASTGTRSSGKPAPSKGSKAQKAIEAKAEAATAKNDKAKEVPRVKKVSAALSKPLKVSDQLAAVVGKGPLARTEVVSHVWEYIRRHGLQNPANKREAMQLPLVVWCLTGITARPIIVGRLVSRGLFWPGRHPRTARPLSTPTRSLAVLLRRGAGGRGSNVREVAAR